MPTQRQASGLGPQWYHIFQLKTRQSFIFFNLIKLEAISGKANKSWAKSCKLAHKVGVYKWRSAGSRLNFWLDTPFRVHSHKLANIFAVASKSYQITFRRPQKMRQRKLLDMKIFYAILQ